MCSKDVASIAEAEMQPVRYIPPHYSGNAVLRNVSTFFGGIPESDTFYSSVISLGLKCTFGYSFEINSAWLMCGVELKRREGGGANGSNSHILCRTFRGAEISSVLDLCRTLVACPFWTQAELDFCDYCGDLIPKIFFLLRSSSSLSTLDIGFENIERNWISGSVNNTGHLPTLLCGNPFLETLTLKCNGSQTDPESFALCFSRNSVLKSCTIWMVDNLSSEQWEMALEPFTTPFKSEANVALKELVLYVVIDCYKIGVAPFIEALVNLVHCNTTLEKLVFPLCNFEYRFAKALEVNHTLKEFGVSCNGTNALKELLDVFIPDSSGHQANTHITSLKVFLTLTCTREECMKEVYRMLELNSTLKHVEVDVNYSRLERFTPNALESMFRNMMTSNMSLESLVVVGLCSLLRVGSEWQMKYHGPCLSKRPTAGECALLST